MSDRVGWHWLAVLEVPQDRCGDSGGLMWVPGDMVVARVGRSMVGHRGMGPGVSSAPSCRVCLRTSRTRRNGSPGFIFAQDSLEPNIPFAQKPPESGQK